MRQEFTATILVAEDDQRMLTLVERFLADANFRVVPATNGFEALEAFRIAPDQIDLFLTDFNMPVLNGFEAAARIREARPEMPVIFMSAYAEAMRVPGGSLFLRKPFSPDKLVAAVAGCLMGAGNSADMGLDQSAPMGSALSSQFRPPC